MISNFRYLTPIAEAYANMVNESFPKDIQQLLSTKYKPVYKDDGYDQFGVDANGKDRKGRQVIWRNPERWFGDVAKLERLLTYAKKKEDAINGEAKHNYDRYGFDTLGFDKQGFDINDKDILGHSGSEYGTEEYASMEGEREHERHNLQSKNSMREYNYNKNRKNSLTKGQEQYIVKAYADAIRKPNPKDFFFKKLRVLFAKPLPSGKLSYDHQSVNYYLKKYGFSDDKPKFSMAKADFANMFVEKYKEQLSRMLRPYSADMYFDIRVGLVKNTEKGTENNFECVITAKLKNDITANKSIRTAPLVNMAKVAANRMELVLPYSGYSSWCSSGSTFVRITLVVTDELHFDMTNRRASKNIEDDFKRKYGLEAYQPPKN